MGAQNKGALLDSEAMMNMNIQGAQGNPVFAPDPTADMFGRNQGIAGQHAAKPQAQPMAEPMPIQQYRPEMSQQHGWYQQGINQMMQDDLRPQMSPNPQMSPQMSMNPQQGLMGQQQQMPQFSQGLMGY